MGFWQICQRDDIEYHKMKILVVTSRYTASRDIIEEDFGRQTRLFEALKKLKHDIDFLCADYRKLENRNQKLHGIGIFIRPFGLCHFLSFTKSLNDLLKKRKYDLLIATSDPIWGLLGYYSAKKYRIKFLYDLHDNYETYLTYKIPFFKYLDQFVIKKSDIITTVSHSLKRKIKKLRYKNVFVIQNGVNLRLFRPCNKSLSRKRLNLPLNSKIIAYTGSLQKSLGVDILIKIFEKLKKEVPKIKLLLVGRLAANKKDRPNLKRGGVISFDALEQKDVVWAINAADVVVIPSPSNEFAKYCFPYKCVEYMACNTPIVATALSDVKIMLKNYKNSLCVPDNHDELYRKIRSQLKKGRINYRKNLKNNTWDKIALKLHKIITKSKDEIKD